ncbi:MAG: 50S ribosomal protein L18 [Patescibacteria group bacterium]|nr:50S ribosomal protein L18 [Patescibacteria group bacterium]
MSKVSKKQIGRLARKRRVSKLVIGNAERPRLSVFRSSRYISAQIIDDAKGITLASASDSKLKDGKGLEHATKVGEVLAEAAKKVGIKKVVFDRNGYKYHGRVKALAEAARVAGLEF